VTRLARFALVTLGVNLVVILWGAVVRATGSGAGCGSHWPLCNGAVVPPSASTATAIEWIHRLTSGLALLLVAALTVACFRAFPPRHLVRRAAIASLVLIVVEAAIGAGIVLLRLTGEDASTLRAIYMAGHLTNTLLLLAALALTWRWADGAPPPRWSRRPGLEVLAAALGLVVVGATGAVTALGDTLFPAGSLTAGLRQDLDASAHLLLRLRVLHPLLAVAVGGYLLILPQRLGTARRGPDARRLGNVMALLALAQLAAGAINVGLLAPVWMQLVHLLLADLLWIALVLFGAALLAEAPASQRAPSPEVPAAVRTAR
jgi:heme A synthase